MPQTTRTQLATYAVALCLIAFLGARYMRHSSPGDEPPPRPAIEVRESAGGRVTVHVAGAVRRPGVYRLREGSRVMAAVRTAGGATRRADLDGLNLAGKVEDGRQIVVPRRGAAAAAAAAGGAAASLPATGAVPGTPQPPIDLNTATLEQLDTLDGIGPATAQKILAYRHEHGGFGSVEELGQVSGIGEKRLAALRERVRV